MLSISRPVSGPVRRDCWGDGAFGAPRGGRLHRGLDLVAEPGQLVLAPVHGRIVRWGWCYPDDPEYRLAVIQAADAPMLVRLLYVRPAVRAGTDVTPEDTIGLVQDLRRRYPAGARHPEPITPHVHLEVALLDGAALVGRGTDPDRRIWINPALLLEDGS